MQQEIITSIDFGSKKLSASVAVKDKSEELEILSSKHCNSVGIEKGLVTDVEKCRENVKNLLKELEEETKIDIRDISIGVSARKLRLTETNVKLTLQEGKVTSGDIREALEKCKRNVLISIDEVIADTLINFYMLDDKVIYEDSIVNWKGSKLELNVTLVVMEKKEFEKYNEIFDKTKYNINYVKSNILSGKQIFLNETNFIGNVALVDIGAGEVDVAVFDNKGTAKHVGSIPVGGNNISNDLAICGEFSFLEAENIKKIYSSKYKTLYKDESLSDAIEVGTVHVSKELFYEVTNARIEEILNHVNIELKKTGHYDRICSIILYGDGLSYFEDIDEIVKNIFEIKTSIIRKTDLGIKNSENITSLAIVKEVYDRLNLLGYNIKDSITKNSEEKPRINERENLHNNEEENHILKKLKGFFNKIF